MKVTLESFKDGQPVAVQVDAPELLCHMVSTQGWPEVIVHDKETFVIEEFDDQSSVYRQTGSFTFDS